MVNGHLEDSLRREIESYLESRLSAVRQEITTLQSLLNESLSTFLDRQADVQMEGSMVAAIQNICTLLTNVASNWQLPSLPARRLRATWPS